MSEQKRVLNNMPGFKKGFEAIRSLKSSFGSIEGCPDEYLAFSLGAIASIYNAIENEEKLWELRKKIWQVEETLGESRREKIKTKLTHS